MVEKQTIGGQEIWLKVEPYPVERENPNVIPTEYFTAAYHYKEPAENEMGGELIRDEDGEPRLFESPVQALTFAWKALQKKLG